jgi:hypothetical protein
MPNYVLEKMMEFEGELTWERYLEFAYLGDPPTPGPDKDFLVEDFADFQNAIDELKGED